MIVRLGGAICVAAITFACSSYAVSSNGIEKEITPRPFAGGPGFVDAAGSYNPYRDYWSAGIETAWNRDDATTWTAAIHLLYLSDYVYSEIPPDTKPADTIRDSLKDVPVGSPVEEQAGVRGVWFGFQFYEGSCQDRIRFRSKAAHWIVRWSIPAQ